MGIQSLSKNALNVKPKIIIFPLVFSSNSTQLLKDRWNLLFTETLVYCPFHTQKEKPNQTTEHPHQKKTQKTNNKKNTSKTKKTPNKLGTNPINTTNMFEKKVDRTSKDEA